MIKLFWRHYFHPEVNQEDAHRPHRLQEGMEVLHHPHLHLDVHQENHHHRL